MMAVLRADIVFRIKEYKIYWIWWHLPTPISTGNLTKEVGWYLICCWNFKYVSDFGPTNLYFCTFITNLWKFSLEEKKSLRCH